jgi:hypothetical protein
MGVTEPKPRVTFKTRADAAASVLAPQDNLMTGKFVSGRNRTGCGKKQLASTAIARQDTNASCAIAAVLIEFGNRDPTPNRPRILNALSMLFIALEA